MGSCQSSASQSEARICGCVARGKRDLESFGRVASSVVHDLRNLNNIVSLTVQNFRKNLDDPAFRQDAMQTLETTTRHMKLLIEKLLAGPTQAGLRREKVTVGELVGHAVELLAKAGRQAQVAATTVRGLDRPLWCEVDVAEMERVFFNLLLNAYEAIEGGGKVSITGHVEPTQGRVCLVIEDTGPGFPPLYVEQCLFCAFRSTKPSGVGVGLFHAKATIEAHGGAIEVVNRAPGRGARVTVTLPAARANGRSAASFRGLRREVHATA